MLDITAAPDLDVLAPTAFTAPLLALAEAFWVQTGMSTVFAWGPVSGPSPEAIVNRMTTGIAAQAVILPRAVAERSLEAGRVRQGRLFDLFVTTIAAAIPASAPQPRIEDMAQLEAYLQTRKSIGVSNAASGQFVTGTLLPGLRSGPHLQSLVRTFDHVGRAVANGTIDIGFQQAIELTAVCGTTLLQLPAEAQNPTVICLAELSSSANNTLIDHFARFVQSEAAAEILSRFGLTETTA